MKKFLSLTMLLASIGFASVAAEAKTNEAATFNNSSSAAGAYSAQPGRWRRPRVSIQVRTVRMGFHTYRVTYRVTRYANGRVVRQMISRVRIR